jgi:lipoyl synthase
LSPRLPEWLRKPIRDHQKVQELHRRLEARGLHTVCREARCPNLGECYARQTATFLVLGPHCSRNCAFCNIEQGPLASPDPEEPHRVAEAAVEMGLEHVVITGVTRDDLPLGGAPHYAATVRAVHEALPDATIEALTPDFGGEPEALMVMAESPLTVFNHNVETAPRLYPEVRAQANFRRSLNVLATMALLRPDVLIKSGMMLGLGETAEEISAVLFALFEAKVRAVTIGQYLQPRLVNPAVVRYVEPREFAEWKQTALAIGFSHVASDPLVRSSYRADEMVQSGVELASAEKSK